MRGIIQHGIYAAAFTGAVLYCTGCSEERPEKQGPARKTIPATYRYTYTFSDTGCGLDFYVDYSRDAPGGPASRPASRPGGFSGELAGRFNSLTRFEMRQTIREGDTLTFVVDVIQVVSTFLEPRRARVFYTGHVAQPEIRRVQIRFRSFERFLDNPPTRSKRLCEDVIVEERAP